MIRGRAKTSLAEHLPANKVLWILVVQATVVLPHVMHLPSWILLTALVTGVWRYHATRRRWRPPSLLLRVLLVIIGSVLVYASYGNLLGRDSGVAMIVLMLALKLLELHRRRDVLVFVLLGYFLVVTNFLYSQSVFMAVYMLLVSVLLTSALAAVSDPGWRVRPLRHMRVSAVLLLQAIPLALLLFVLFPRISGPLWKLPDDAYAATTGLSDRMSPGTISHLAQSNEVAFRVDFFDPPPPQAQMYWRGPVLDDYDGRTWSAAARSRATGSPHLPRGRTVQYQITLEATDRPWLLALDVPQTAPTGTTLSANYELLADAPVRARTRYALQSRIVSERQGIAATSGPGDRMLQLPAGAAPRTRALAQRLADHYREPQAIVHAALMRFRKQEYVYTLDPPRLGNESVDQFLFETRRGFCEHYAGAFVVLMRAAGIPARVVTGYQGGEHNPTGDYWIVRQSDAHAWAEVWLSSAGWVRIDPTGFIAPQRIEAGIGAALPEQVYRSGFSRDDYPWLRQLDLAWDSVNNHWNQWVLGYSPQRQMAFLQDLGMGRPHWLDLALMAAVAVAGALLVLAAIMAFRFRPPRPDPTARTYGRFCRKLERVGLGRRPHEGPVDFARRVSEARPDLADAVLGISDAYVALRYGNGKGGLGRFARLVAQFSPIRHAGSATKNAPTRKHAGASANSDCI